MLTCTELKELLEYDPETGLFRWLYYVSPTCSLQWFKGNIKGGYCTIGIKGKGYKAHRLAWLYMTGEWPKKEIDHLDQDRQNNRYLNLRDTSRTNNQLNKNKNPTRYTSKYPGVSYFSITSSWRAIIGHKNKRYYLGYFETEELAFRAYLNKKYELLERNE